LGGTSGIHVGDDSGDTHRRVEQRKQRESRQVHFTRLNVVELAQKFDLLVQSRIKHFAGNIVLRIFL